MDPKGKGPAGEQGQVADCIHTDADRTLPSLSWCVHEVLCGTDPAATDKVKGRIQPAPFSVSVCLRSTWRPQVYTLTRGCCIALTVWDVAGCLVHW